ncbi:MAG: M20/M25/M40 family metallo-hydrolase, partial [Patescibacteria group bacterium]
QPADKKDGWDSDPFEVVEKDGRLVARGIEDNKGQVLVHIFTIGELIKEGKLKKNVKFFIEGNEETANAEIVDVIRENQELLRCNYVLISDGEISNENPAIDVSFRGGVNMKVILETAKNDVHSGLFGGAFPNAAMELSTLISKFYDTNNRIAIDGFYKDVQEPTKEELDNNASIEFDLEKIKKDTGIKALKMEKDLDFYTQTGLLPMLTVTGFKSGFIGEGFNNIVPCRAECKINFRFSAGQKPKEMVKLFKDFVLKNVPDYVDVSFETDPTFDPVKIDITNPVFNEAKDVLEEAYGEKLIFKYCGASIPVVSDFLKVLDKPVLSIGFANEDANSHGVDENFRIDLIEKALRFSRNFFGE